MATGSILAAERTLLTRIIAHLRQSERWQLLIKLLLILGGGLMAGAAQFDIGLSATVKPVIGVGGAVLVFIGGALLLAMERDSVILMSDARAVLDTWRDQETAMRSDHASTQAKLDDALRQIQAQERALIDERAYIINSNNIMTYADEARMLKGVSIDQRLEQFLRDAVPRLTSSLKVGGNDFWTVSVFRKQKIARTTFMIRAHSYWSEPGSEKKDQRKWKRGKGWTGKAWQRMDDGETDKFVIERDATTVHARARYSVDPADDHPEDKRRYVSVLSIPFAIHGETRAFGVVTVTSSRAEMFGVTPKTVPYRNFNAVRDFVRLIASLASIESANS